VSHTDAWVKVTDTIEVKLNVFLDDVVRHQIGNAEKLTQIPADEMSAAVKAHSATLLSQLRIFDDYGNPLSVAIRKLPKWKAENESVSLAAAAALKLTWVLEFQPQGDTPDSLCFVHSFTHPDLTSPGELRLHVQYEASAKRVDAVVAPGRPHTIQTPLKALADSGPESDRNLATSRIVVSPLGVVHEFMAPLLLLDAAWPPAAEFRQQITDPTTASIPTNIQSADVDGTTQQITQWMTTHVVLRTDGMVVSPENVVTEIFPAGGPEADTEEASNSSPEFGLPLFGTLVGVRMTFAAAPDTKQISLTFLESPGDFSDLTTELCTSTSTRSVVVPIASVQQDSNSEEPAVEYHFSLDQQSTGKPDRQPDPESASLSNSQQIPITSEYRTPGKIGMGIGAGTLLLALGFLGVTKQRMSKSASRMVVIIAAIMGLLCAYQIADTRYSGNLNAASALTESLLARAYRAVMQPSERQAVEELHEVLNADLSEEVYLGMLQSLQTDSDSGLVVEIDTVELHSLQISDPPESADQLKTQCVWRVRGIVQHWGHRHFRDLSMAGQITLVNSNNRWKIQAIQPTSVTAVTVPVNDSAKADVLPTSQWSEVCRLIAFTRH